MNPIERLAAVLDHVRHTFVAKDSIIDLLGIALLAKENAYLLGPPGTAKSAIVRQLTSCVEGGRNFEYLLTRFTEPNEIFGPFDIRKLREGDLVTNTEGMMPEASLVFLDEIFNANSALLNSLLMALNEKIFRRGKETIKLPALMFVGASNQLPEDEALNALLDRFLLRIRCDYVDTDRLGEVLNAGWKLERNEGAAPPTITADEIRELQVACRSVNLAAVQKDYIALIHDLRTTGVKVSDRRAVKCQNLIAASALMSGRTEAILSDLWVLRYIWDTEEQIELINGMVNSVIEKEDKGPVHPRAMNSKAPDAEELIKEIESLHGRWDNESTDLEERNIIKDKLRYLQNRSQWISHPEHKSHLQEHIDSLWQKMLTEA